MKLDFRLSTTDSLIREVKRNGLRVNNLFQLENGTWQANVTDGTDYWEFGTGSCAPAALFAALGKWRTT